MLVYSKPLLSAVFVQANLREVASEAGCYQIIDIFLTASSRVFNKNAGFLGAPPDVFRIKHWTEFEVCSSSLKLFLDKPARLILRFVFGFCIYL